MAIQPPFLRGVCFLCVLYNHEGKKKRTNSQDSPTMSSKKTGGPPARAATLGVSIVIKGMVAQTFFAAKL